MVRRIRKLLLDILVESLNSDQINSLGREVDPRFNLGEVSGFGEKIVIPRRVAADCVIRYFNTEESLIKFLSYMVLRDGQGASGGVIQIKGKKDLFSFLKEYNYIYDANRGEFKKDQATTRTSDWGLLKEGGEYWVSFAAIDIVSSSNMVRTNVKSDVEVTFGHLRDYINRYVESWNGRIWFWYGDGGVAAFYGDDCNSLSVLSMINILSYLPVFNIARNELRPENDVKLRIGMHYGTVVYHADVSKMHSEDLKLAQDVEKECSEHNALAITETAFFKLRREVRARFAESGDIRGLKVYSYRPT